MFTRGYPNNLGDGKPQDERPVGSVGQEGRREAVRVWECLDMFRKFSLILPSGYLTWPWKMAYL
jgi:hypothetical protein